jgi:RNA 3'-terminal phosphate cyclase
VKVLANAVATELIKTLDDGQATVDEHLADQFLIYMAMLDTELIIRVKELSSRHARTNKDVLEQILCASGDNWPGFKDEGRQIT